MNGSLARLREQLSSGVVDNRELIAEAAANHRPELAAYRAFGPGSASAEAAAQRYEQGRASPLTGLPISIKDIYGVPGFDTYAGSPRRLPQRFEQPGWLVRTLLEQGAVVMGKTHTVEFAFGGLGRNAHWPTPVNPWDAAAHRVTGGSSSGAGVSLCEGSAVLALATDTAGSVRVPAAMTGNAGLKLSAGRWPSDGIVPLSPTLDTPGMLARSVADLCEAFTALDPSHARIPPLDLRHVRLARPREAEWWECSEGIAEAVEAALLELESAGLQLRDVDWPESREARELFRRGGVAGLELAGFLQRELPAWLPELDPNVAARLGPLDGTDAELASRRAELATLAARAAYRFEQEGVLVTPTVRLSPPKVADLSTSEAYRASNSRVLESTCCANYLGACALTVPVGLDALGLPVGLQLTAAARSEVELLALGAAIEMQLGTMRERCGRPPRDRDTFREATCY